MQAMRNNNSYSTGASATFSSEDSFREHGQSVGDVIPGKIFVGGLHPFTNERTLFSYFSQFGEVEDTIVKKRGATGISRHFGFVFFKNPFSVNFVLAQREHYLDGKKIDPKVAVAGPTHLPSKYSKNNKKIFVGGVSRDTTVEQVKEHFSKYGAIEDAVLKIDHPSLHHRGFGFLTFVDEQSAKAACDAHFHEINGKRVEAKPSENNAGRKAEKKNSEISLEYLRALVNVVYAMHGQFQENP